MILMIDVDVDKDLLSVLYWRIFDPMSGNTRDHLLSIDFCFFAHALMSL